MGNASRTKPEIHFREPSNNNERKVVVWRFKLTLCCTISKDTNKNTKKTTTTFEKGQLNGYDETKSVQEILNDVFPVKNNNPDILSTAKRLLKLRLNKNEHSTMKQMLTDALRERLTTTEEGKAIAKEIQMIGADKDCETKTSPEFKAKYTDWIQKNKARCKWLNDETNTEGGDYHVNRMLIEELPKAIKAFCKKKDVQQDYENIQEIFSTSWTAKQLDDESSTKGLNYQSIPFYYYKTNDAKPAGKPESMGCEHVGRGSFDTNIGDLFPMFPEVTLFFPSCYCGGKEWTEILKTMKQKQKKQKNGVYTCNDICSWKYLDEETKEEKRKTTKFIEATTKASSGEPMSDEDCEGAMTKDDWDQLDAWRGSWGKGEWLKSECGCGGGTEKCSQSKKHLKGEFTSMKETSCEQIARDFTDKTGVWKGTEKTQLALVQDCCGKYDKDEDSITWNQKVHPQFHAMKHPAMEFVKNSQ